MSNTCLECFGTGRSRALPGFPCSTCNRAEFFASRDVFNNVRVELPAPEPQSAQPCPYSTKPGASPARVQPKPYSAADLAGLRTLTETHDPASLTPRFLATLDQMQVERDQALASLKVSDEGRAAAIRMMDAWKDKADKNDEALTELREAAGNLVSILVASGGGRECSTCYALATVADPLPRGGSVFRCEKHARPPLSEWEDDPQRSCPTHAAAALRRLRTLVEVKP